MRLAAILLSCLLLLGCKEKKTLFVPDICLHCPIRPDWSGIDCYQVPCDSLEVR